MKRNRKGFKKLRLGSKLCSLTGKVFSKKSGKTMKTELIKLNLASIKDFQGQLLISDGIKVKIEALELVPLMKTRNYRKCWSRLIVK